jgi:hypothetical protein
MRFRHRHAVLILCALSLQACTTFIVAARQPGEVLAESPNSVRLTLNDGRRLEMARPHVRNGYVVEALRDSVRLSDVKQIEVPKIEPRRTLAFIVLLIGLSLLISVGAGSSQAPDDGTGPSFLTIPPS